MIDVKEIIEKHQKLIAQKYKLGNSLVTGHRKGYFDEAAKLAFSKIIELTLQTVANEAVVDYTIVDLEGENVDPENNVQIETYIINGSLDEIKEKLLKELL